MKFLVIMQSLRKFQFVWKVREKEDNYIILFPMWASKVQDQQKFLHSYQFNYQEIFFICLHLCRIYIYVGFKRKDLSGYWCLNFYIHSSCDEIIKDLLLWTKFKFSFYINRVNLSILKIFNAIGHNGSIQLHSRQFSSDRHNFFKPLSILTDFLRQPTIREMMKMVVIDWSGGLIRPLSTLTDFLRQPTIRGMMKMVVIQLIRGDH